MVLHSFLYFINRSVYAVLIHAASYETSLIAFTCFRLKRGFFISMLSFDMSQRRGRIQQLFSVILYSHKPRAFCRQYITSNIDQFNFIFYVLFIYYSTCGNGNKIRIDSRIHVKNAVIISLYDIVRRHFDHLIRKRGLLSLRGDLKRKLCEEILRWL